MVLVLSCMSWDEEIKGLGVRSDLIEACVDFAYQRRLSILVLAFPNTHLFYQNQGFSIVRCAQIDMSAWQPRHPVNKFSAVYALWRAVEGETR